MNNDQARGKVLARKPKAKPAPKEPAQKAPYGVAAPKPTGVFAKPGVPKPVLKAKKPTQVQQRNARKVHDTAVAQIKAGNDQPSNDPAVSLAQAHMVFKDPKKYRNSALVKHLHDTGYVDVLSGYPAPSSKTLAAGSAAMKILDQTTRPLHAVAAGTDAAIKGKNVPHALSQGIKNKDKTSFSDVLKHLGAPKSVQAAGGFAGDILLDPTTYVTGGAGAIARKAAEKAAADAEKQALRAGLTKDQAARFGQRAANQAAKKAPEGKGVTVKFAGQEAPGVRRATAAVGRGTKKVAGKTPQGTKTAAGGAKNLVRDVRPTMAPAGVDAAEHRVVHNAAAETRAQISLGQEHARVVAHAVQKHLPNTEDHAAVIDAIERGRIGKLPEHLRQPAVKIRSELRGARRKAVRSGLAVKNVEKGAATTKTRTSKTIAAETKPTQKFDPGRAQRAIIRRLPASARQDLQALRNRIVAELNSDTYIDVRPLDTQYEKLLAKHGVPSLGELEKKAQDTVTTRKVVARTTTSPGRRKVGPGEAKGFYPHALDDALKAGQGVKEPVVVEGVGRRTPQVGSMKHRTDRRPVSVINAETPGKFSTDIPLTLANYFAGLSTAAARAKFNRVLADVGRPVQFGDEAKAGETIYAIQGANIHKVEPGHAEIKGGRYVALNTKLAESELAATRPIKESTAIGHLFNQGNRGFKRLATFTPGFHVRNAIGDTQMAFLSQPGHRLVVNTVQGGRLLKEGRRQRKLTEQLKPVTSSGKTMKVAGKRVPIERVYKGSRENAAAQTGYIGRELNDLVGRSADGSVKKVRGGGRVRRAMQARENLMRNATYKHGLDRGMSPTEAGRLSRDTHIDYGDLTNAERQIRRVMPFYTFSARSIPLHAQKLLTNPGKFAAYQKVREESAKMFGLPSGWENDGSTYQKQQVGVPMKAGGHTFSIGVSLPLIGLNQLPVGKPGDVLGNNADFFAAMVTPILKDPVEFGLNRSFFTHNDVQDPQAPLVAAPIWVKQIYRKDPGLARKLGITPHYQDKRSGKATWGWYGKADYIARVLPGPFNILKQLSTPGSNRAGQGTPAKVLAGATGIKPQLIDPTTTKINDLYSQWNKLKETGAALSQQGIKAGHMNAEKANINATIRDIERQIYQLKLKRGDQNPSGAPSTPKLPKIPGSGLGGGLGTGLGINLN